MPTKAVKLVDSVVLISSIVSLFKGTNSKDAVIIVTAPRNQAILANQTVVFDCTVAQTRDEEPFETVSFRESITLKSGRTISIDDRIVYNSSGGDVTRHTRYDVTNEGPHTFKLQITAVSPEDAGKYSCTSSDDVMVFGSAELIVIEEPPKCQTNATTALDVGEVVMMTCEVTSQGRWAPVIHWSNKQNDVIVQNETQWETPSGNARTVRYTVIKTIDTSDNDDVYVAKTHFETVTDVGENEATNTPRYKDTFTFDPLVVKVPHPPPRASNVRQTPVMVKKVDPAPSSDVKIHLILNNDVTISPTVIATTEYTEGVTTVESTVITLDTFEVIVIISSISVVIFFVIVGSLVTVLLTGRKSYEKDQNIIVL